MRSRKIAVDFDGTIVENAFPKIGKERPFAFRTLQMLQQKGFLLILWTCRSGAELTEAVDFCRRHGVEFYAVNKNYSEEVYNQADSPKVDADIYIDDRNINGIPDWGEIYQLLTGEIEPSAKVSRLNWSRLFR